MQAKTPAPLTAQGASGRTIARAVCSLPFFVALAYSQVHLTLVATDRAGNPVTDLRPGDLLLTDKGMSMPVTSLDLVQVDSTRDLVVLLDLMNLTLTQRGFMINRLNESLVDVKPPPRIYLFAADGRLFPVRDAGSRLDQALKKVTQVPPVDARYVIEGFRTTYSAMDSLNQELARFPGRKLLLWITDGIPISIHDAAEWMDMKPRLRELAARFNRGDVAVYALNPSLLLANADREGLEFLTAATGGRTFNSSDLTLALKQMRQDASATYRLVFSPSHAHKAGSVRTVRVSCARKQVRIASQQVFQAAAIIATEHPTNSRSKHARSTLAPAPAYTFVGAVHALEEHSLTLQLDDRRCIIVDFRGNAPVTLKIGESCQRPKRTV